MIVRINTHPIVKEMHEEYHMDWCGRIIDTHPEIVEGKPVFIVAGKEGRIEMNTLDMDWIERVAKSLTSPHGRAAVTTDRAFIYIKEIDGKETLMGVLTHEHIKTYNQMYDEFEYN